MEKQRHTRAPDELSDWFYVEKDHGDHWCIYIVDISTFANEPIGAVYFD
jgi:hypothetical protein